MICTTYRSLKKYPIVPEKIYLISGFTFTLYQVTFIYIYKADVSCFHVTYVGKSISQIARFRFVVLRRVFFIGGIHYYYRAITMYVTVLPKPDLHYPCAPQSNETTVRTLLEFTI